MFFVSFDRNVFPRDDQFFQIVFGWEKYTGSKGISLGMKSFGKSAPYNDLYKHFKLTSDDVVKTAKKMLGK